MKLKGININNKKCEVINKKNQQKTSARFQLKRRINLSAGMTGSDKITSCSNIQAAIHTTIKRQWRQIDGVGLQYKS